MPILDLFIWTRMTSEQPAAAIIRRASVCLHPDRKWAKFSFPFPSCFYPQFENVLKQEDRKFYCFFSSDQMSNMYENFFFSKEKLVLGSFFPINSPLFITFLTFFCTKENVMTRQSKIEIWLITNKCLSPGCTITCNVMRSRNN